ncbi:MAG: tyrosine-type recombinase/integrase, partial [Myxococcota bacterium]
MGRAELSRLEVSDVQVTHGTLLVREGKGKRDRVVPVGARAMRWVLLYLRDARPTFSAHRPESRRLFLGARGEELSAEYLGHKVRRLIEAAGLDVRLFASDWIGKPYIPD